MSRILIVEDEELICRELTVLLSNAGYEVRYIRDFSNLAEQIRADIPELILLDITLPGLDGYQICTAVRSFSQVPIIFITGRNTAMDELQALMLGGDDYVTKPYNVPVLLARISRLLERGKGNEQREYMEYKGIQLFLAGGILVIDEHHVELTKTELKIMYYLFKHAGTIVSRLELVEYLWDNEIHIDDNTLSVNVMRIREKLGRYGAGDLIQTKRGMGYKV